MLQLWRGAEKMSAIPYMPLYVADYLADAAHLTTEEHGAYMLLIMTYWQRGKPLPADPCRLANIARMTNERWTDVQQTLSEFFVIGDGVWAHKRIEAELSKFRDKSDKAKAAGKASGERRKSKPPTDAEPKSNGRSTDVQRTLNHTDTDTEEEKSPKPPAGASDDMPDHVKPVSNWSNVFATEQAHEGVRIEAGSIVLVNGTRAEWLERFGGDAEGLDLALIQIAGQIQPNSRSHSVEQQTSRHLAKIVQERRDRDRRYRDVAAANAAAGKSWNAPKTGPERVKEIMKFGRMR